MSRDLNKELLLAINAKKPKPKEIRRLIEEKANPCDDLDGTIPPALFQSVNYGQSELIRLLVQSPHMNPDILLMALFKAILNDTPPMIRALVDAKADIEGKLPSTGQNPLEFARKQGRVRSAVTLLELLNPVATPPPPSWRPSAVPATPAVPRSAPSLAEPSAPNPGDGATSKKARKKKKQHATPQASTATFADQKAKPTTKPLPPTEPLSQQAIINNFKSDIKAKKPLDQITLPDNVDVDVQDKKGHSVFLFALAKKRFDIAEALWNKQHPKPSIRNNNQETALMILAFLSPPIEDYSLIKTWIDRLVTAGFNVDAKDRHDYTALMLAARQGHKEIVEHLLHHKAQIDLQNVDRQTALTIARRFNHEEVASLLASRMPPEEQSSYDDYEIGEDNPADDDWEEKPNLSYEEDEKTDAAPVADVKTASSGQGSSFLSLFSKLTAQKKLTVKRLSQWYGFTEEQRELNNIIAYLWIQYAQSPAPTAVPRLSGQAPVLDLKQPIVSFTVKMLPDITSTQTLRTLLKQFVKAGLRWHEDLTFQQSTIVLQTITRLAPSFEPRDITNILHALGDAGPRWQELHTLHHDFFAAINRNQNQFTEEERSIADLLYNFANSRASWEDLQPIQATLLSALEQSLPKFNIISLSNALGSLARLHFEWPANSTIHPSPSDPHSSLPRILMTALENPAPVFEPQHLDIIRFLAIFACDWQRDVSPGARTKLLAALVAQAPYLSFVHTVRTLRAVALLNIPLQDVRKIRFTIPLRDLANCDPKLLQQLISAKKLLKYTFAAEVETFLSGVREPYPHFNLRGKKTQSRRTVTAPLPRSDSKLADQQVEDKSAESEEPESTKPKFLHYAAMSLAEKKELTLAALTHWDGFTHASARTVEHVIRYLWIQYADKNNEGLSTFANLKKPMLALTCLVLHQMTPSGIGVFLDCFADLGMKWDIDLNAKQQKSIQKELQQRSAEAVDAASLVVTLRALSQTEASWQKLSGKTRARLMTDIRTVAQFSEIQITQILRSLAKLGLRKQHLESAVREVLLQSLQDNLPRLNAACTARILWTLRNLGFDWRRDLPNTLTTGLLTSLAKKIPDLKEADLAMLMISLAGLGLNWTDDLPDNVRIALVTTIQKKASLLNAQQTANVLWGLAMLNIQPNPEIVHTFEFACLESKDTQFNNHELEQLFVAQQILKLPFKGNTARQLQEFTPNPQRLTSEESRIVARIVKLTTQLGIPIQENHYEPLAKYWIPLTYFNEVNGRKLAIIVRGCHHFQPDLEAKGSTKIHVRPQMYENLLKANGWETLRLHGWERIANVDDYLLRRLEEGLYRRPLVLPSLQTPPPPQAVSPGLLLLEQASELAKKQQFTLAALKGRSGFNPRLVTDEQVVATVWKAYAKSNSVDPELEAALIPLTRDILFTSKQLNTLITLLNSCKKIGLTWNRDLSDLQPAIWQALHTHLFSPTPLPPAQLIVILIDIARLEAKWWRSNVPIINRSTIMDALRRTLVSLLPHPDGESKKISSHKNRQLINLVWAVAKLEFSGDYYWQHYAVAQALLDAVDLKTNTFNLSQIATLLWSLPKWGIPPHRIQQIPFDWFSALQGRMSVNDLDKLAVAQRMLNYAFPEPLAGRVYEYQLAQQVHPLPSAKPEELGPEDKSKQSYDLSNILQRLRKEGITWFKSHAKRQVFTKLLLQYITYFDWTATTDAQWALSTQKETAWAELPDATRYALFTAIEENAPYSRIEEIERVEWAYQNWGLALPDVVKQRKEELSRAPAATASTQQTGPTLDEKHAAPTREVKRHTTSASEVKASADPAVTENLIELSPFLDYLALQFAEKQKLIQKLTVTDLTSWPELKPKKGFELDSAFKYVWIEYSNFGRSYTHLPVEPLLDLTCENLVGANIGASTLNVILHRFAIIKSSHGALSLQAHHWETIVSALNQLAHAFTPKVTALVLQSLAILNNPIAFQQVESALFKAIRRTKQGFDAPMVAKTAGAFATLGKKWQDLPHVLQDDLLQLIEAHAPRFNAQTTANILAALATWGLMTLQRMERETHIPQFCTVLLAAVERNASTLNVEQVAAVLWALVRLNLQPTDAVNHLRFTYLHLPQCQVSALALHRLSLARDILRFPFRGRIAALLQASSSFARQQQTTLLAPSDAVVTLEPSSDQAETKIERKQRVRNEDLPPAQPDSTVSTVPPSNPVTQPPIAPLVAPSIAPSIALPTEQKSDIPVAFSAIIPPSAAAQHASSARPLTASSARPPVVVESSPVAPAHPAAPLPPAEAEPAAEGLPKPPEVIVPTEAKSRAASSAAMDAKNASQIRKAMIDAACQNLTTPQSLNPTLQAFVQQKVQRHELGDHQKAIFKALKQHISQLDSQDIVAVLKALMLLHLNPKDIASHERVMIIKLFINAIQSEALQYNSQQIGITLTVLAYWQVNHLLDLHALSTMLLSFCQVIINKAAQFGPRDTLRILYALPCFLGNSLGPLKTLKATDIPAGTQTSANAQPVVDISQKMFSALESMVERNKLPSSQSFFTTYFPQRPRPGLGSSAAEDGAADSNPSSIPSPITATQTYSAT